MSLTAADTAKAKEIVDQLVWQPANGHNFRYSKAINTLTRYCEAASMEPDVAKLVIEYLKNEVITDGISLLNKRMDFGNGWKAIDAWYQTAEGEKFAGTESSKVRIYQTLMQHPDDGQRMGEHELTALEHSDVKNVALFDDTEDTPEPQTLTIEDVDGVTNPLPIAKGQTKPEGFSGAEDQAGGNGRKIIRKRIVVNEETGRRDRQIIERTSIPYKKNMSWSDDNSDHEILVFRNQKTVPTVKTSITVGSASVVPTNTTITVNINEFGLFDGVYHYTHTVSGGRSGEALAWSIGPKNISAKYYYFNKKGKLCHRVFEGTVYKCYGRSNHVANELYNQDAITPAYLPQVGWVTHMGDGLFTHGTRYTLTKVGDEVDDDDSSQSSQS